MLIFVNKKVSGAWKYSKNHLRYPGHHDCGVEGRNIENLQDNELWYPSQPRLSVDSTMWLPGGRITEEAEAVTN